MRMAYFGEPRDAPIYDAAPRIAVPVGYRCVWCEGRLLATDEGFQYTSGEYTHRACMLRVVLGPVANQILEAERKAVGDGGR